MQIHDSFLNFTHKEFPLGSVIAKAKSTPISLSSRADYGEMIHHVIATVVRAVEKSDDVKLEVEVPLTWWEHFKRDVMPKWFTKRYPIRTQLIKKEYKVDLESVALVNYEHVKHLGAHSPFIRLAVRQPTKPMEW